MDPLGRGKSNLLFFQVEDIDKYLFVDSVFTLSFWILDLETNLPRLGDQWLVNASIAYDPPMLECSQSALDVISCSGIDATGYGKIQCRVKDVSLSHGNRRFCLVFDATNPHTTQTLRGQTNSFVCVRHKLVIKEENQSPYAWYKDEGGKDKCIEFQAILIDSNNIIVVGRVVALRAILMYYGGQPVLQQNILTVSPDSRAAIDETGTARIKLRINEVSNRHRGQLFQVLISPHFNDDVSPALSMPVEVRSKRNTNTKREASQVVVPVYQPMGGHALTNGNPYVSGGGYSGYGGDEYMLDSNESLMKRARMSYLDAVAGMAAGSAVTSPPATNVNVYTNSAIAASTASMASSYSNSDVTAAWSKPAPCLTTQISAPPSYGGSSAARSVPQQQQQQFISPNPRTSPSSVALASELSPERQYEQYITSFRSIVLWTHKVLTSLQDMQWLQIGFDGTTGTGGAGPAAHISSNSSVSTIEAGEGNAVVPSLGEDLEVPVVNPVAPKLFQMTNPNERIKDIIEMYKMSAKGSLEFMKSFIENHHQDHQQFIQMKDSSPVAPAASTAAAAAGPQTTEWFVPQPRQSNATKGAAASTAASFNYVPVAITKSASGGVGNDAASSAAAPLTEEELSINLVLAKSVLFAGCFLGTPVFNVQGTTVTCLGFYECYSHNNVAKVNFHSLKSQVTKLSLKLEKVVSHIQSILAAETSIDTGNALFHLSQCNNDLNELKERAMCACILNDFENYY